MNPEKYNLLKALRPFSYSVALISCGLGVVMAHNQGSDNWITSLFVIIAGVLLQMACNLANDYEDIKFWRKQSTASSQKVISQIKFNLTLASICTLVACLIGINLAIDVGWPLFLIGAIGVTGGYFYTGEPVNYKKRGLGVIAVFLLTGILMANGSYYALTGLWSNKVLLASIPVSFLTSALLISNELRDFQDDLNHDIQTLTVRIGLNKSRLVFATILLLVYPFSLYLYWIEYFNNPLYLLASILFVWSPLKLIWSKQADRDITHLPPLTGRFFMVFGIGYLIGLC